MKLKASNFWFIVFCSFLLVACGGEKKDTTEQEEPSTEPSTTEQTESSTTSTEFQQSTEVEEGLKRIRHARKNSLMRSINRFRS